MEGEIDRDRKEAHGEEPQDPDRVGDRAGYEDDRQAEERRRDRSDEEEPLHLLALDAARAAEPKEQAADRDEERDDRHAVADAVQGLHQVTDRSRPHDRGAPPREVSAP